MNWLAQCRKAYWFVRIGLSLLRALVDAAGVVFLLLLLGVWLTQPWPEEATPTLLWISQTMLPILSVAEVMAVALWVVLAFPGIDKHPHEEGATQKVQG